MLLKFSVPFLATVAVALGGIWLGLHRTGSWWVGGWIIAGAFAVAAILQALVLVDSLAHIRKARNLERLEQRDAKSFAQGKSFDDIIAHCQPKR